MSDEAQLGRTASARLAGRKIIVTGGASGIGRATCTLFAREGAKVCVMDRDRAMAETVARELNGVYSIVDLAKANEIAAAVKEAARKMDGIDGIVNAAGIVDPATVENTSITNWERTIAINLTAPFLVVQAALPFLLAAQGSTVINISSGAALLPRPGRSAYTASKGGLLALSRGLAAELAPAIRVNAICPGSVETPMLLASDTTKADADARKNRYALKRLGKADEVADAILFLTSAESAYITGVTLAVDGGRTFH